MSPERSESGRFKRDVVRAGCHQRCTGFQRLLLVASTALFAVSCAAAARPAPPGGAAGETASMAITRLLEDSAEAWNRGDLDGFLEPYLDSPEMTYVGGSGIVRGKEELREVYRRAYWTDEGPAQSLRFTDLEVRMLGSEHALVLGGYRLYEASGAEAGSGPFTLVLRRTAEGWRVVHDHSS